jgi:hypothetical protein
MQQQRSEDPFEDPWAFLKLKPTAGSSTNGVDLEWKSATLALS